jgi:biotin carboxyl carrier protein
MKYITTIEDKSFDVEVLDEDHIRIGDRLLKVDFESVSGQPVYSLLVEGDSYEAYVQEDEDAWQILLKGRLYTALVVDEREQRLKAAGGAGLVVSGEFNLKAPMPGLVISVLVNEGDTVSKGQVLLILESMKMQNELKSPRDGVINRVRVKSKESVEQKQTLLTIS